MHIVLDGDPATTLRAVEVDAFGEVRASTELAAAALASFVRDQEPRNPRWVWSDTARWYPPLLRSGVTVARCLDLRRAHALIRTSAFTAHTDLARDERSDWDAPPPDADTTGLFELAGPPDALDEFRRQQAAVADAPARFGLLLAAESTAALVAAELTHVGLPWRRVEHERVLRELLGPRPAPGHRPAGLELLVEQIRAALDAPALNPDSAAELLRALRAAGLEVASTRAHVLERIEHPVIAPLLEYRRLSRVLSANGWQWLDTWVHEERFRAVYLPGAVVTGRWASSGGGALQLPAVVRSAVRADPGWRLVVADAAQLEPRVLAAMARDHAMAAAGREADLYEGMVAAGAVETRQQAKYGMLGAMYGGTRGESGRMLPRIARAYPRAVAFVEAAARAGERGERVTTWLGRTSPEPGDGVRLQPGGAALDGTVDSGAEPGDGRGSDAATASRAWGRFTRNFVVQGSAAEWASCWMGALRRELRALCGDDPFAGPHLVFFLHDELIVHSPLAQADRVAELMRATAREAGRLLFGDSEVDFRVTTAVVESYDKAK